MFPNMKEFSALLSYLGAGRMASDGCSSAIGTLRHNTLDTRR